MNVTVGATLLFFALLGGVWGWYRATKAIYRRYSPHSDRPDEMSASEYERAIVRSRKRWRPVVCAMYSIGGALVGCVVLLAIALRR
jgi:hypothetical protein